MKRFLTVLTGMAAVAAALWLCAFYFGFYIDFDPDAPVTVLYRTHGKELQRLGSDRRYVNMELRAVDVSSSLPGHPFSDFAADREDYLRWFGLIGDMGANAVQADTLMDADFYDALYEYNSAAEAPLYLFQGLSVTDGANYGKGDAYGPDFSEKLMRDGKAAVDIIHGRRSVPVAADGAVGRYRKDVSPWVAGYIVGYEWNADTVAYTDHSDRRPDAYRGKYLSAKAGATRFEVMLAEVTDAVVSYEARKYKEQRLISFSNDPSNDPFEYAPEYEWQLPKFSRIDAEHIEQREYGGLFAAYRIYDFCPDPPACFSEGQRLDLSGRIDAVDRNAVYGGYLEILNLYHSLPVYIMGYGFSSARAPVNDEPPLTELEQGQRLAEVWREAERAGCVGVCISSWQDTWERRT